MIDAYTIGITLALDDGISAGVAAIAKDLRVLDRAIESSALRLAQLRRVADGVLGAGYRPPPPGRAEAKQPRPVEAESDSAAPSTSPALPRESMPPALQAAPVAVPSALELATPLQRGVVSQPAMALSKPPPIMAPPPVAVITSAPPPAPSDSAASPEPAAPAARVVSVVHAVRPVAAPAPVPVAPIVTAPPSAPSPVPAPPAGPPPAFQQGVSTIDLAAFAHRMTLQIAETTPTRLRHPSSPPPRKPSHPVPSMPVPSQHVSGMSPVLSPLPSRPIDTEHPRHGIAPRLVEQHILHVPAGVPLASRPAAPPPASSRASPVPGGDVFLDGVRVGRWLSRHLDRVATRPPAGMTGFDPRLSPSWAGATVSN